MREALYRKHRPKRLDDVVGQPHITKTLQNAIDSNRISHGYLFAGPRGVGKTSVARILAHQINDFTYDSNNSNILDIVEIDAASNRRIDEIRELRDKIHTAPVSGKYKVYIIDEVHMLTKEAFNALLKTLEEPPEHVVFILATTEIHKVPETIISRTQHFTFRSVESESVIAHLDTIANQEGISIDRASLELIANYGQGSFRDSIGLLDQLSSLPEINEDSVNTLLGLPPHRLVRDISEALHNNKLTDLISLLDQSRSSGISANHLSSALIDYMKKELDNSLSEETIALALKLLNTSSSTDPDRYLELILIDYIVNRTVVNTPAQKSYTDANESKPNKDTSNADIDTKSLSKSKISSKQNVVSQETDEPVSLDEESWNKILSELKKQYNTLYGIARMGRTEINNNTLTIYVRFPFHQKRLKEDKNAKIIHKVASQIIGSSVKINIQIDDGVSKQIDHSDTPDKSDISNVTKIFEGAELLES